MRQGCLCHKIGSCVAIQQGLGSRRARWGAQAWALGRAGARAGALGRAAGAGVCGRRGAGTGRAAGRRWARGLALGYALGALGLFLARFDSVFFSFVNFWTLFVNPVHEHCSSRIFSKKKNILNLIKNEIKSNKI